MAYERWVSEVCGTVPEALLQHSSLHLSSLKQARKIIEKGLCSVNGVLIRLASKKVSVGDSIEVYSFDEAWKEEPCTILFQDEYLYVIEKPAGVSVDDDSIRKILPVQNPIFLVHRLDKWTSGALIIAKNKEVQEKLESLFRERKIRKDYLALVDGIVEKKQGTIDLPIEIKKRRTGEVHCGIATHKTKKEALTQYKLLLSQKKTSLLLVTPKTGRTHQIRVHLSHMGHPLLGDIQYAMSFLSMYRPYRQMLHAWKILFPHPILHKNIFVKTPIPQDFQALAESIFGDAFKEVLCGH